MPDTTQLKQTLESLFRKQKLAVLATQVSAEPYCNLVAFSHSDDLKKMFFATARSTRKFQNLLGNPRVCMLVDNRSNSESDFSQAVVATAFGTASEVPAEQLSTPMKAHLKRHASLERLLSSSESTLVQIEISHYLIVNSFQQVSFLEMKR